MQAYQKHLSAQAEYWCLAAADFGPWRYTDRSVGGERRIVLSLPGRARHYSAHSSKHRRRRR